jgi:hypothetical protein
VRTAFYIVLLLLIPFVIWGIGVIMSPVVGQGEQYKRINSEENRTFQYQHFFDLNATIHSQAENLKTAKMADAAFEKQYPPSPTEAPNITELRGQKQANVAGIQQLCVANVQKYNNDAQEFTRNQFLDRQLPASLSIDICGGV